MPRGGRRPGAGAPKGNLNALKGGRYSPRVRFVLSAMLAVPEYRAVIQALIAEGERARATFDELMTASLRILYERPVSDEIRAAVSAARERFLREVGRGPANAALRERQRRLGVDAAIKARRTPPDDALIRAFMAELFAGTKRT
jgi:hypothetical protein